MSKNPESENDCFGSFEYQVGDIVFFQVNNVRGTALVLQIYEKGDLSFLFLDDDGAQVGIGPKSRFDVVVRNGRIVFADQAFDKSVVSMIAYLKEHAIVF